MTKFAVAIKFDGKDNYSWVAEFHLEVSAKTYKKAQEKLFPEKVIIMESD